MELKKKKLEFRVNENGCFIVTSHRLKKQGYCYVWHVDREYRAHRLIYQECFGEIPQGLVVRHKCDVPGCINPEHLELGTPRQNVTDAVTRKRNAFGEKNGKSTITEDDARKIKAMLYDGMKIIEVSRLLNVSPHIVGRIKTSNSWKHIAI